MQKTTLALLGALLSIAGPLRAQKTNNAIPESQLFDPPPYSFTVVYKIRLGDGNMLDIQLSNGRDIRNFRNIDSLLTAFLDDMKAFRDSLSDPLTVKHLDYLIDSTGRKKLRIRQYRPAATSFLLDEPEPAILRTQQDTINILLVSPVGASPRRAIRGLCYDRLSFFVNHYGELETLDIAGLKAGIATIISHQIIKPHAYNRPTNYIVNDSILHTDLPERLHDQLQLDAGGAVENYKSNFAPSVSVSAIANLNRGYNQYRLGVSWEPIFLFSPNAQGHLRTYIDNLVVVNYEHTHKDHSPVNLDPAYSLGYIVGRQGDYFPQPSFRFTFGVARLAGGAIRIEPCLFFNNFFRGVTPGLRLSGGGF
ncbi:MAG TPA: hypothetical protein VFE32_19985 [Puia sp.]|jgi:hypothetical protein|nr:hypothetical protein [Puia sp.]